MDWINMSAFMSNASQSFNPNYESYYKWIIFYKCRLNTYEQINFIINRYKNINILFNPVLTEENIPIWDNYINSCSILPFDMNRLNKIDKILDARDKFAFLLKR